MKIQIVALFCFLSLLKLTTQSRLPFVVKENGGDALDGSDILCPDNLTYCKERQTCCLFSDNKYGCCALPDAVCCDDKIHCCPKSYKCNPSQGKCDKHFSNNEILSIDWIEKEIGRPVEVKDVPCPGGSASCPDGNTCCQLASGQYGCCPLENAVCCSDHQHCCPNGYKCDTKGGRCIQGQISIPFYLKTEAKQIKKEEVKDVPCPGGSASCPDGNTCCQLASGQYGCCPLENAVCCSDHQHCCPNGYKCDTKGGRCLKGAISIPFYLKTEAKQIPQEEKVEDVPCPGGSASCPDGNTCCQLASGQYGCCPLENAVCCSDHQHCCPNGYKCDTKGGRCIQGQISIPFYLKTEAKQIKKEEVKDVPCPGGSASCPDGNTCCQLASGQYGCCPLENAVCCSDHQHCCPNGYKCDTKGGRCIQGDHAIPFYLKIKAKEIPQEEKVEDVPCPGGSASCPDGNTCCQLASGQYGCCPLENAVCCSDHQHCCPNGYKCDTKGGRCIQGGISIPFYLKTEAKQIKKEEVKDVPCPGGSASCPDGNTCCQLASGQYGCCPLENAVCCSDHQHCCPNGYTCDTKAGRCNKGDLSIPFHVKTVAKPIPQVEKVEDVPCPGGSASCPDGNTCCQLASGQYGCCPLENAVCCSDHQHCCPNGYKCDTKGGRCIQGDLSIPFYLKTLAKQTEKNSNAENPPKATYQSFSNIQKHTSPYGSVPCADGSFCANGFTCCELPDGTYGCCPLPNAVCCSDHVHCCPQNYKCDMKNQCCTASYDESKRIPWVNKQLTQRQLIKEGEDLKVPQEALVCDSKTSCPPMSTCCKMTHGDFGCCPYDEAVCCGTHCCPKNAKCGKELGECVDSSDDNDEEYDIDEEEYDGLLNTDNGKVPIINWHTVELLSHKSGFQDAVCPGGEVSCSNGTCCQVQADSSYACCPYENGTCCGSHGYCCPKGYTCDPKLEACTLNDDDSSFNEVLGSIESIECNADTNKFNCPNTYSCCPNNECCPIPQSVCCENSSFCCPVNFKCEMSTSNKTVCVQEDIILDAVRKVPSF